MSTKDEKIKRKIKKIVEEETNYYNARKENNKAKLKNIANIILKTISILIIILLIITIIRSLVFKKTDIFGYRVYLIMSGSMEQEISVEDAILVRETNQLLKGDIIAFQNGNSVTVHRIVNIKTEGNKKLYQTKGDNNNIEDSNLVEQNQIKGKYVMKISGLGKIAMFFKRNLIFVILSLVILTAVFIIKRLI